MHALFGCGLANAFCFAWNKGHQEQVGNRLCLPRSAETCVSEKKYEYWIYAITAHPVLACDDGMFMVKYYSSTW
jgi:hypothetical protein